MSRLFKSPKMPAPPPAPAPIPYNPPSQSADPAEDASTADATAAINEDAQEAAIAEINKKKKGRKATILTGPQGLTTEEETYQPTLLG